MEQDTLFDGLNLNKQKTIQILWFDVDAEPNDRHKRHRSSENELIKFQDVEMCKQYIHQNDQHQIVLIINGSVTPGMIDRFHSLHLIKAIYIRSADKNDHHKWDYEFRKVCYVDKSIEVDQLIDRIRTNECRRSYWLEPLGFHTFSIDESTEEENTSTRIDGQFLHSQLLLDSLLTMSPSSHELASAIAYFRTEYVDNPSVLDKINEFEINYLPDRALFWYTQDSFFYRFLNKAFRVQDIDTLYAMRIFVRQIREQLIEQQRNTVRSFKQVYRGQLISKLELQSFQTGELISINSFFSTTLIREVAIFFVSGANLEEDTTPVLFEININEDVSETQPFANITNRSALSDEFEVLFMVGSIFRITNIDLKTDNISVIELMLCGDNDHNLKLLFEHMRADIPPASISLTYGIVLANASKVEQAEKFFRNVLNELNVDDPLIIDVYHQLGNVLDDRGKFQESLEYYEKSLTKKLETLPSDDPSIANTYTCCGVAYYRKNEFDRAEEFYQKALNIYKKVYGEDDKDVAMCLLNIGDVKFFQNKFQESLQMHEQAFNIWIKCLPENHPDIARSHASMGMAKTKLFLHEEAAEHFEQALSIMEISLPEAHSDRIALYDNIGNVYYAMGHIEAAEEYLGMAFDMKEKLYLPDHPAMADSYSSFGLIYKGRGKIQEAVSLFEEALSIQSKRLPRGHETLVQLQNYLEETKASPV